MTISFGRSISGSSCLKRASRCPPYLRVTTAYTCLSVCKLGIVEGKRTISATVIFRGRTRPALHKGAGIKMHLRLNPISWILRACNSRGERERERERSGGREGEKERSFRRGVYDGRA